MIYKIIVDKQPMSNPNEERKEYEIDIAPLYFKHDVYDSLVITHNEDYVMRRLELQDYNVLVELDPPVKEPLTDINIELFEGENYIYLYDMVGNKIVAQYLVKNEFNELYVLETEMHSAIRQSANEIELIVGGQVTTLDGAVQDINGELSLKVDKNDNDQVVSMINASADEINLTSNRLSIDSTNFQLTKEGDMTCSNANITGGNLQLYSEISDVRPSIKIINPTQPTTYCEMSSGRLDAYGSGNLVTRFWYNIGSLALYSHGNGTSSIFTGLLTSLRDQNDNTTISFENLTGNITCVSLTQTSKEEAKKNFEKLPSGLDIIKNIDIYKYNMKADEDDTKKHIGFVIGDNCKYSEEVTSNNNDGVDIYSFVSVCCKAIQEQQEEIQELKEKDKQKDELLKSLLARIEKLEKGDK